MTVTLTAYRCLVNRKLIADYRLIARLGRGRMTEVFLGIRDGTAGLRDLVVIKRLRADAVAESGTVLAGSPLDEARLATRLRHPNIGRTFDAGIDEGLPYRATEYVDGQPLDRILRAAAQSGGLSERCALCIVRDVLSALHYAHELSEVDGSPLGIVHADVQPHNIFVTYRGAAKLVDFGAPKPRPRAQDPHLEESSKYFAPEQLKQIEPDRRTDVYQAGLVLWECLTVALNMDPQQLMAALTALRNVSESEAHNTEQPLHPDLAALCRGALAVDMNARYPNAAAMSGRLEPLLGDPDLVRQELGTLVQQLFEDERTTRARRVESLWKSSVLGASAPPPPFPPEVRVHPSTPALGVLAARTAALETAALAAEDSQRDSRVSVPHKPPMRLSLPQAQVAPSVRPERPGVSRAVGIGAAAAAAALVVGLVWMRWPTQAAENTLDSTPSDKPKPAALPNAKAETVLRLCGSNTIGAELAPALVQSFFAQKGGSDIVRRPGAGTEESSVSAAVGDKSVTAEIRAHGSSTAFKGLADGSCDIGMASRAIDEREVALLQERGHGDLRSTATEHVIALDGIAVVVHPNNHVRELDRAALHDIFTGKITDWSQLQGQAGPISVLARDDNSGTFDTFKHLVLGKDALVPNAKRFADSEVLSDAVAGEPSAIGFVGLAYVRAARAVPVGEPGARPMLPSHFSVATEGYMLSRRLYFYTLPKPRTSWVTELVSFVQSPRAQEVTAEHQFVDLRVTMQAEQCQGQCPPQYVQLVQNAERVSLDFRFRSGSDEPDSRAGRDVERLVRRLGDLRDRKLLLLGFADAVGNAAQNSKLSLDRAKAIAREFELRGIQPAAVRGFGAALPVGDNNTDPGRQRNRRVEAWLQR